jgi:hypothetical protein
VVVSTKPVVRLVVKNREAAKEQILVDMERRLLFADKEKGGRNATEARTSQPLLRGTVLGVRCSRILYPDDTY